MSTKEPASGLLATAKEKLLTELSSKIPPRWKHQDETVKYALNSEIVFDTSDPGTGKTRGHIDAFVGRLATSESDTLLVVCPKSLMEPAWVGDFRKFAPGIMTSTAFAENRAAAFEAKVPVFIINTDGVKWLAKKTPTWIKKHFGLKATLVVDESTAFKHHTSARSRALKKLAKHFPFRTLMTGTPITTSVTDIWHQMMILDRGERLGSRYTQFRNSTQIPVPRGGFTHWEDKPEVEETVAYMIRDISIRHLFEEVMDVPENYSRTIDFRLSRKVLLAYQAMENDAFLRLEQGNVSAVNAVVLNGKLLQIASGAVYGDGPRPDNTVLIDNNRHELVLDLVEERDHSVAFFNWTHQRDELAKQAKRRGITHEVLDGNTPHKERTRIVERFQAGDLRTVFLHPQTGVHGLTLTKGTATIWASPRYEPDFLKQGIHRIYRGGQTRKTENILLAAQDTIEPLVYEKLGAKYKRMVNLLDLLKERRGS